MKMAAVIICALFAASAASADIYTGAEQLARKAAGGGGGNSAPQNPAPPTSPPQQNIPPPNPVLEATLRNISNLRVDFDALGKLAELKSDSPQKKLLLNDLTIAPQGAKPSSASISMLADNLASAVVGKKSMQPQHAKLAQEIHAIFNSSHLSAAQQQVIFGDVQKILQDDGASADDTINVVSDIKTIATETK
jgi:hypothetical protein